MTTLNQLVAVTVALIAILVLFSQPTLSSSSPSSSQHESSPNTVQSVSSWIRDSLSSPNRRLKRASLPWEWTIDALKCSLKIMSLQVSHYHNNELMCCGLWKIKSIIKQSAVDVCDNANHSVAVFNEMIKEDLIYSSFSKSLLGDETLDCAAYPEGSPVCDQLWRFIWVMFVLLVLVLIALIIGSCVSCYCCIYWRNRYQKLASGNKYPEKVYHKAGSESELSDTSSTNNNKIHHKTSTLTRIVHWFGFGKPKNISPRHQGAAYNGDDMRQLTIGKNGVNVRPVNGTQASLVANGASGQTTPTDRCSSAASTNSSNVPSHKDDPV